MASVLRTTLSSPIAAVGAGGNGGGGQVLTITLDRPNVKNATNNQMFIELTHALEAAASNDDIGVVVLTATGDYFSSGADFRDDTAADYMHLECKDKPVGAFMRAMVQFPKIIVAAVNGHCVGVGVTMLLHADFVYAVRSATFWCPFARIGVVPEFASSLLFPRILGPSLANELLLAGRKLTAPDMALAATASSHSGSDRHTRSRVVDVPQGLCSIGRGLACPGLVGRLCADVEHLHREVGALTTALLEQPLAGKALPMFKGLTKSPAYIAEVEQVILTELEALDRRLADGDTFEAFAALAESMRRRKEAAESSEAPTRARL